MSKKKRIKQDRLKRTVIVHGITVELPRELSFQPVAEDARLKAHGGHTAGNKDVQDVHSRTRKQVFSVPEKDMFSSIASIATQAWHAKNKMVDPETGEARDEMRRVYRHIENILDALKLIHVDIIDPIGRAYDSGMALKVISFEETPGFSKEEIKETLRPTIMLQERIMIQMGEVIVGTPVKESHPKEKQNE